MIIIIVIIMTNMIIIIVVKIMNILENKLFTMSEQKAYIYCHPHTIYQYRPV